MTHLCDCVFFSPTYEPWNTSRGYSPVFCLFPSLPKWSYTTILWLKSHLYTDIFILSTTSLMNSKSYNNCLCNFSIEMSYRFLNFNRISNAKFLTQTIIHLTAQIKLIEIILDFFCTFTFHIHSVRNPCWYHLQKRTRLEHFSPRPPYQCEIAQSTTEAS